LRNRTGKSTSEKPRLQNEETHFTGKRDQRIAERGRKGDARTKGVREHREGQDTIGEGQKGNVR